eukprot:gene26320-17415_t
MGDISLWKAVVKTDVTVDIEQTDDMSKLIHLTNVALGPNPSDEPHTAIISKDGIDIAIATLVNGKCHQHALDLVLDSTILLKNTGGSALHFSGYLTVGTYESDMDEDDDDGQVMERQLASFSDEDEDEDYDSAPKKAQKIGEGSKKVPASAPPKVQPKSEIIGGEGADEADYEKALIAFLKKSGKPQPMASLGISVKRPAAVPKLSVFAKERPSKFKVDAKNGTIALA